MALWYGTSVCKPLHYLKNLAAPVLVINAKYYLLNFFDSKVVFPRIKIKDFFVIVANNSYITVLEKGTITNQMLETSCLEFNSINFDRLKSKKAYDERRDIIIWF